MSPYHKILANLGTGTGGSGGLFVISWMTQHVMPIVSIVAGLAACVLTIFSALNALNTWRDRREARRREAAAIHRTNVGP